MAIEVFKAETTALGGLKVNCKSREFEFTLDEPKNLGGTNTGMNPVEALLNSLGACLVIVAQSYARVKKINLKSFKVNLIQMVSAISILMRKKGFQKYLLLSM